MAAYKTAIKRNKLSAPLAALEKSNQLVGRILDYGCGRGGDVERLNCEGFDPHYRPDMPSGVFDTITCNFVLNVIESERERRKVLCDIAARLAKDGLAYITVRSDKKALTGRTSIGTWQGFIELDLPIVKKGSGYITYAMTGRDWGCKMFCKTFDKPAA